MRSQRDMGLCGKAATASSLILYFCLFCLAAPASAQQALTPFTPVPGPIVITERSDFSRYENSRYTGFSFREARLDLVVEPRPDGSALYRGEALVFEETLRDMRAAAKMLDASVPVAFTTIPGGAVEFLEDRGYPILRGVPTPPPATVQPKGRWTAEATVVVRPKADAPATRVKVLVEYEYIGPTMWSGMAAQSIRARYAVRYRGGDRLGDPALTGASGGRTADILVDPEDGSTLFIREALDESYTYSGGATVRLKGFILHFHRGSLPLDRERIAVLLGGGGEAGSVGVYPGSGTDPGSGTGPDTGTVAGPDTGTDEERFPVRTVLVRQRSRDWLHSSLILPELPKLPRVRQLRQVRQLVQPRPTRWFPENAVWSCCCTTCASYPMEQICCHPNAAAWMPLRRLSSVFRNAASWWKAMRRMLAGLRDSTSCPGTGPGALWTNWLPEAYQQADSSSGVLVLTNR